jgi:hypothetical protein
MQKVSTFYPIKVHTTRKSRERHKNKGEKEKDTDLELGIRS